MHKEYKEVKRAIIFIIISFFVVAIFIKPNNSSNNTDTSDPGIRINNFEITMDVKEDNRIDVTEVITAGIDPLKHGIFRFIPQWLEYTGKDGKVIKRKSLVQDIDVVGDPFTVSTVKKKKKIKIGDPYSYVHESEKTYTIKYTYNMGSDPFRGFDELIFHAFGDYWGTPIKNASLVIHMPKEFDTSNIKFFTDKYRKEDVTSAVDYYIEDNTIYATLDGSKLASLRLEAKAAEKCEREKEIFETDTCEDPYQYLTVDYDDSMLNSSLTVDIELPEGYFISGSYNYGVVSFILSIGIILLTLITVIKWYKYGKDLRKKAETVEFYPPDDLDASQLGFIYDRSINSKKLVAALIVEIASKGYIKIDEVTKSSSLLNKKDIQFTNLVPEPDKNYESKISRPIRVIEVKKIKDIDDELSKEEKLIMKFAFKEKNKKKLDSNIEKFLNVRDSLVSKGYIEVLSDNEDKVLDTPEKEQKAVNAAKKEYEAKVSEYNKAISKLKPLTAAEQIVYDKLFSGSAKTSKISTNTSLYKTLEKVEKELEDNFKENIYDKKASDETKKASRMTIPIIIMNILSYFIFEDLDPRLSILYTISYACIFINLLFAILMSKRTEYGETLVAKIKGFKRFLTIARKDELEALVAKNPQYFYDILPYTYVLGVSKKWIKKFEDIPMPEMNIGDFKYDSDSFYSMLNSNLYRPSSGGGGGWSSHSSCGGGCSSCGGGCSSCGGGGSW